MDPVEVGECVATMEHMGLEPLESDASRSDGHMSEELMHAAIWFYEKLGLPQELTWYARADIDTQGPDYRSGAAENSGRIWTSIDTWLKHALVYVQYQFWNVNGKDAEWTDETRDALNKSMARNEFLSIGLGDDALAGTAKRADKALLVRAAAVHGHKYTVADVYDWDLVTYCSSRPYRVGGGRRVFAPSPFRMAAKTFIAKDSQLRAKDMPGYIKGIFQGTKHYSWLPVLSDMAHGVKSKADCKYGRDNGNPYKMQLTRTVAEVDPLEVSEFFFKVYGYHPDCFRYLRKIDFSRPGIQYDLPLFEHCSAVDGLAIRC